MKKMYFLTIAVMVFSVAMVCQAGIKICTITKSTNQDIPTCEEVIELYQKQKELDIMLNQAAVSGNTTRVEGLLTIGANVNNERGKRRYSPLHLAVKGNHLETAKMLINNNANVNARDKFGYSPLHLAVQNENIEMIKMLVQAGSSANAITRRGASWQTPLGIAIELKNKKAEKILRDSIEYDEMILQIINWK